MRSLHCSRRAAALRDGAPPSSAVGRGAAAVIGRWLSSRADSCRLGRTADIVAAAMSPWAVPPRWLPRRALATALVAALAGGLGAAGCQRRSPSGSPSSGASGASGASASSAGPGAAGGAAVDHSAAGSGDAELVARLRPILLGAAGARLAGIAVAGRDAAGARWEAAVGCARFAADGVRCARALTADSPMRVASISKLFTTVALLQQVERGALSLDGDVARWLGLPLRNPAFPDAPITLRSLLSHTSSLRDGDVYSAPPPATLAGLLAAPGRFDDAHPPGAYFHYDNINFTVAGALLERVTGKRFDRAMRDAVLAPAGVDAGHAWSGVSAAARARHATLYRRRTPDEVWRPDGPWVPQVDDVAELPVTPPVPPGANPFAWSPHGGLRISARQLVALLGRLIRGERDGATLLGAAALDVMLTPRSPPSSGSSSGAPAGDFSDGFYEGFGLGVHAARLGARRVHGHFGDAYGLKAGALFDAATGEVWVYAITGYGAPPPPGSPRYPGLDAAEAAILDVLAAR
jgi:CubicO group peptidase (beta-lactamase class C family)